MAAALDTRQRVKDFESAEEFRNYLREAGLVVLRTPTTAADLKDDLAASNVVRRLGE